MVMREVDRVLEPGECRELSACRKVQHAYRAIDVLVDEGPIAGDIGPALVLGKDTREQ